MNTPALLLAPWAPDQVARLDELQRGERYGHPYTCPERGDGRHHDNGHDLGCLVPTATGWVCSDCTYTQGWAFASTMDAPRLTDLIAKMAPAAAD
jgi:hypothetical protein